MRHATLLCLLTVIGTVVCADLASAGPFRRIWERRKAELQGELSAQLNYEVDVASQQLASRLDTQLEAEAERLEQQMETQLAALREEAMAFLAAQSQKIEAQVVQEVQNLKKEAGAAIAAEAARVSQSVEAQVASLHQQANKQLRDALTGFDAKAADHLKSARQNAQTAVEAELARIRAEVEAEKARQAQSPSEPAEPAPREEQAAPTTPVQLKDEEQQG